MKTESTIARDPAFEIAELATAIAYSDCHEHFRDRGSRPDRNLNFCCAVTVSVKDAIEITRKFINGYNAFSPELLSALPADCRVRIAREGSIAIYCETSETLDRAKLVKLLRCDEWLYQIVGKTNTYRIWWD